MPTSTTPPPTTDQVHELISTLRAADRLNAKAARIASVIGGEAARATGLPIEMLIRLEARRTGWDANEIIGVAEALRHMPALARALERGSVSWSQARLITRACRQTDAQGRTTIDRLIGRDAEALAGSDPDELVERVDSAIAERHAARELAREDRATEGSFLAVQARLDGHGGRLWGEADAASFATIVNALDAAADGPALTDEAEPKARSRQRMDALVAICSASAAGDGVRPAKPRFLVSVSIERLDEARILNPTPGRPLRLSPVSARTLACDAELQPVVFDRGQPVGVGPVKRTTPARVRRALDARDGGCRFPGCRAPAAWTDAHHIDGWRTGHDPARMLLLCRRCHRRVHRHRWSIEPHPDGTIGFRHRGRHHLSHPRAPKRE